MAGIKISALPVVPSAQLTDTFPVVQLGTTYKESNAQLLTLFQSNLVSSVQGTINQVLVNGTVASPEVGALTLTTPQDIATTSNPIFNNLRLNGGMLLGSLGNTVANLLDLTSSVNYVQIQNGATGNAVGVSSQGLDANISMTMTSKGTSPVILTTNAPTQGIVLHTGTTSEHVTTLNFSDTLATRNVTFQDASGTLAYLSDIPAGSPSALTKVDDTNVTLTLGGTPATALLQATSLTLGWTGTLSETRGGTSQFTYILGDTLYSSAPNTLSKLAGNITSVKQYLSQTGTGAVSAAPAWATISGSDITGAALTKVDDTNVTMTLGGTPATSLLRAASLTLGWTGTLGLTRGGTAASLTASNGGIVYSNASTLAILAGTATARQMLQSGTSTTPAWSTATWPATTTANQLLYSSATNTVGGLTSAASSVLVTDGSSVPSLATTLPASLTIPTPTISGNATFTANTAGIAGIINSASKAAGVVGEVLSQVVVIAGPVTTAVDTNIATVTLTAGNWMVEGELWSSSPGGTTQLITLSAGISTTSATMPTAVALATARSQVSYGSSAGPSSAQVTILYTGSAIIRVAGNTSVWLVGNAIYVGSACNLNGQIKATRFS